MVRKATFSFVVLAFGITGCASSRMAPAAQNPEGVTTITSGPTSVTVVAPETPVSPGADQASKSATSLTDAQILAVVDSAGNAEREIARDALRRAGSERVRQIAQRIVSDHVAERLDEVEKDAGVTAVPTPTSTELTSSGARALESVRHAEAQELDRVYLDTLQGEERSLVRLLDETLIPQAQDAKLQTLLRDLRTSVASRVAMGEDVGDQR